MGRQKVLAREDIETDDVSTSDRDILNINIFHYVKASLGLVHLRTFKKITFPFLLDWCI